MNNNPNRGNSHNEKQMDAITKTTSVVVPVALGLALAAGAAEPIPVIVEVERGSINEVTANGGTIENRTPLDGGKGLRLAVQGETGKPTSLSLRTSAGNACVLVSDIERGPVLIPSLGLYLVRADGPTMGQFREKLAAKKLKTARQKVLAAPEADHASAMAEVFGENAEELPAFPTPPYESPMQIEVPEKALTDQWRLGAWHLKRWCRPAGDDVYHVSIWRFRFQRVWDRPGERKDYETTFAKAQPTCIAQESHEVIRALDMLGVHDVARGGLNHWMFAEDTAKNNKFGNQFTDFDGTLLTINPGAGGPDYDMKHPTGHGLIMEAAALHYRMTGNKEWFLKVAPRLQKACEWSLRQRLTQWQGKPRTSWGYGLLPPINFGDYGGAAMFYMVNARFYTGLKSVATIMVELGVEGAEDLLKRIEEYRQDIVAAVEQSAALTPVVAADDGTYRRFIPATPNNTSNKCGEYDPLMGFACLADRDGSVYAPTNPLVSDALDLIEQSIPNGITKQVGYEAHPRIYLLNDDVPLFLRSLYKEYAVLIRPWELEPDIPKNRTTPATPVGPAAYEFFEHPGRWAVDKTFEEAVFLQRMRNMLVMEMDDTLWLARATPRVWLEQGKKISVKNSPTYFGTVTYEIVSDVDNGKISATVEMPTRPPAPDQTGGRAGKAPKEVVLRFRHPKSAPLKGVTVNGKPWTSYDKDKETITLKDLTGTVAVTAQY
jgi:hypothetical protein